MFKQIRQFFARKDGRQNRSEIRLEPHAVPQHIAIIMDGNGRWAKMRSLPRMAGHRAGMKTVKEIVKAADEIGVKYLTMYAFSTENWKRPREEVDYLMKLPQEFLASELHELMERNVRVRRLGQREGLPDHTLEALDEAEAKTSQNTGLQLNFAVNYGGRHEIVTAVNKLFKEIAEGKLRPEDIKEEVISEHLFTGQIPDPDLLIRTSGEIRVSNFMLWQLAYTEFWFTDVYWPDFTREHFLQAVEEFQRRVRRYGAV
jgi:undecaprenyl diphosphate synthase